MNEGRKLIEDSSETLKIVNELAEVARVTPNLNIEFWNIVPSPDVLRTLTSEGPRLKGLYI